MKPLPLLALCLCWTWAASAQSQELYLSRFLPDSKGYEQAEVTLFNPSESPKEIGGYAIITRRWKLVLPAGIQVPPLSSMTFAGKNEGGALLMARFPGFSAYAPLGKDPGDFVALVSPQGRFLDGCYLSETPNVDFLPATIADAGGTFTLPAESHQAWYYLATLPDPLMAYDRVTNGWQANGRSENLFPATEYLFVQGRMTERGAVSVKWKTRFENDCLFHIIDRSLDGTVYEEVGRRNGLRQSNGLVDYQFTDTEIAADQRYWYRIRHVDRVGEVVVSSAVLVRTNQSSSGFRFDVFSEGPDRGQFLRVRYTSLFEQEVRLKLLDEQLRQLEILSAGKVTPNREYLVTYRKTLPAGVYYLLIETEQERYHEVVVVE